MQNTERITTASRKLRRLCTGLIFCLPVICALFWIFFNQFFSKVPMIPLPVRVTDDLPALTRFLAFLADLIPLAIMIAGLQRLRDLFRLYEKGLIFTEENVNCFRSLGRILIIWVACDVVRRTLLGLVLTMFNPPGRRILTIGLDSADFTGVFVGIVVLIISWVMDEARKIQEDQALFI
jgi:hypothetical protein